VYSLKAFSWLREKPDEEAVSSFRGWRELKHALFRFWLCMCSLSASIPGHVWIGR